MRSYDFIRTNAQLWTGFVHSPIGTFALTYTLCLLTKAQLNTRGRRAGQSAAPIAAHRRAFAWSRTYRCVIVEGYI